MSETVRPFHCGSQFGDWVEKNCAHCKRAAKEGDDQHTCDIEKALWEAYMAEGKVPANIGQRMGYVAGPPFFYCWPCGEVESTTEEHAEAVRKWREA